MHVAVVADDLTGAADTGVQLARAGYRTAVLFRGEGIPAADLDAVSLDTDSRMRPAGSSRRRALRAPPASSTRSWIPPYGATSLPSYPPPWERPVAGALS